MTDIEHLINMNVELEGLLRVLESRDSASVRSLLAEKAEAYNTLLKVFLSSPAEVKSEIVEPVVDAAPVKVAEEQTVEEFVQEEQPAVQDAAPKAVETPVRPVTVVKTQVYAAAASNMRKNTDLTKAFTINDRFRFKRELFGGNDADFTDTLQLLSEMETYSEAEDYLLNDMMWNRDDTSVIDFLSIIANNLPDGTR